MPFFRKLHPYRKFRPHRILVVYHVEGEPQIPDTASDYHRAHLDSYSSTAQTVSGVATFAGAITLSTQFLIQCPRSRLQALLALASQLFLAIPLVLLAVAVVLYARWGEKGTNWDNAAGGIIVAQFMVSGVMLFASFALLSCAIYVAEGSGQEIGKWGLVLISLVLLLVLIVWCSFNTTSKFRDSVVACLSNIPRFREARAITSADEEKADKSDGDTARGFRHYVSTALWRFFISLRSISLKNGDKASCPRKADTVSSPPEEKEPVDSGAGRKKAKKKLYSAWYLGAFLGALIPQLIVVGCLIGYGVSTAMSAKTQFGCT